MVTGEPPGNDEESPAVDEITLQRMVTQEAFFVDFLRTDEHDEDGVSKNYAILVIVYSKGNSTIACWYEIRDCAYIPGKIDGNGRHKSIIDTWCSSRYVCYEISFAFVAIIVVSI